MAFVPLVVSPTSSPRQTAILVVEGEALVRATLVDARLARDHVVFEAANNLQGFDILHGDALDVMLSDRPMPVATGALALAAARRETEGLKGLIAEAELPDAGRRAWLDGYAT